MTTPTSATAPPGVQTTSADVPAEQLLTQIHNHTRQMHAHLSSQLDGHIATIQVWMHTNLWTHLQPAFGNTTHSCSHTAANGQHDTRPTHCLQWRTTDTWQFEDQLQLRPIVAGDEISWLDLDHVWHHWVVPTRIPTQLHPLYPRLRNDGLAIRQCIDVLTAATRTADTAGA